MKQISFQNANICYNTSGKGLPVVLLHGFAEDSTIWDNQVEFLRDRIRLIIPDLPGSGKSEMITKKNTGIEEYADCIKEILSAENIERCVMIGHSMGGYITLAFAEKYPEALISFGLFHSSAYADDDLKKETRKKAIGFIKEHGAFPFLQTSIPGLFCPESNSEAINALIEKGKAFSAAALIQYYEAMIARPDRTAILKHAPVPVLFIMGEHDKAVPFKHSLEQSYLPGESYVNILRKTAHMGMLEETGKSNEILANFLLSQKAFVEARQLF